MFSVSATQNGSIKAVAKQLNFATASALTKTAKDAQAAAIASLKTEFDIRTDWLEPSRKLGIRIKPAKKSDLTAEVKTAADFLEKFEEGTQKIPRKRYLAIPTANVRRNKRDIITKANRPKALRGKRTFLVETQRGLVLFQRKFKGKRTKIVPLYVLRQNARTPRKPTFYGPVRRAAEIRFPVNFIEALKKALETAN